MTEHLKTEIKTLKQKMRGLRSRLEASDAKILVLCGELDEALGRAAVYQAEAQAMRHYRENGMDPELVG